MHELAFADAARPTQVRVLGLLLRPYSIGHELLLLKQRNPFITQRTTEIADLPLENRIYSVRECALICSQTWRQTQGRQRNVYWWSYRTRHADWDNESDYLLRYLSDAHASLPHPTEIALDSSVGKREKGRQLGAPFLAQLINFLTERPALLANFSSVHDFPYALASMLYFSHLEASGICYIENADESDSRMKEEKIRSDVASEQSSGLASTPPDLTTTD